MPPEPKIVRLKMSEEPPTRSELTKWEINRLDSDQSLVQICTFGGPPTEETLAENARRAAEYERRYVEIVKKYEVEEEYIGPMIEKRNRLWAELVEVCARIKLFQD